MRALFIFFLIVGSYTAYAQPYTVNMAQRNPRPIPEWYNEDKFGIFVVWGPYSVPAFSDGHYAEWYWHEHQRNEVTKKYHEDMYGKDFAYEQFADQFRPILFDPDYWCDLFAKSGAKYVATTANYHDGFAMYPTEYAKTNKTDQWNSVVRGPKMDIIGALNKAGEKHGLKMGIYYSLYEWYHPLYLQDKERFAVEWLHPKFKEVVSNYRPWFIFLDGDWDQSYKSWHAEELASWLYNESPVKDKVVVNDRWGVGARGVFGDVFSSEYGGGKHTSVRHPWQEDRGIGRSYGYNRNEKMSDYDSRETLIQRLSEVIGGGGNFLLDVGPTADGRIPVIMEERLLQIGEWLKINGEAIYGTTANPFWPRLFEWGTISKKPGKLFIHVHDSSLGKLSISDFQGQVKAAKLLSAKGDQAVELTHGGQVLALSWNRLYNDPGVTIIELDVDEAITGSTAPEQFSDGTVEFNCWAMEIHGKTAKVAYAGHGSDLKIVNWTDPTEYVTGQFTLHKPGAYDVKITYQAPENMVGSEFVVTVGGTALSGSAQSTNNQFKEITLGQVQFGSAGLKHIEIKPKVGGKWSQLQLRSVKLERSK